MSPEWEQALRRGAVDDLARLLAGGLDIDALDRHGQTSLMRAAAEGDARVVRWLVERGARLDHTAKFGLSALMIAAIRGHTEVAHALAASGADRSLRGTGAPGFAGKTALDLAAARGAQEIVDALREPQR